jgi:ATP-GRASP peptide maturase of grasp-with-spasm system
MILILSQDVYEPTTELVMNWIRALGGDCVRIASADLTGRVPFEMGIDGQGAFLRFQVDGREFSDRDVRAVWLRRWQLPREFGLRKPAGFEEVSTEISLHLAREASALSAAVYSFFPRAKWLTHPDEASLSKLHALRAAAAAGLEVPATLVTSRRGEIEAFRARYGRVITKPVGEVVFLALGTRTFGMYTAEPRDEDVAALPEKGFPSLVQELVEKEFEVRAFYLDGELHSMAIFSQLDEQTALDFRQYNARRPNRAVPYRLPGDVARAACTFMRSVGLTSGSVDLIRTPDGRHVFLEVNPAGQFLMVSNPCNYRLEKVVAQSLMTRTSHADA